MNQFRNEIRTNFTAVPNSVSRNPKLSWKAKGIFMYLASRPEDWEFFINEIKKNATDGKDSLQTGLKELEKQGYLIRTRSVNKKGQFTGWDWTLTVPEQEKTLSGLSEQQKTDNGKIPLTENPSDGKSLEGKTPSYTKKESTKKENTKKEGKASHPFLIHVETNYPRIQQMPEPLTDDQAEAILDDYKSKAPEIFPDITSLKKELDDVASKLNNHTSVTKMISADQAIRSWLDKRIQWKAEKPSNKSSFTIQEANDIFMANFSSSNGTGTPFETIFQKVEGTDGLFTKYKLNPKFKSHIKKWPH